MKVYQTDANGFLVGEVIAEKNPLENGFLIPAGCVIEQPPAVGQQQAAQYKNGAWALMPDLRGVEYWHLGQKKKIENIGESLPQGATLTEPQELIAAREAAAATPAALAELAAIDLASIRAMREYIASKADAPQILKNRETAAQEARAKLK